MPYTFGIHTLGCKVNQYESEALAELAVKAGFSLCEGGEACDVCVINTCTVTGESDRKSRQLIRRVRSQNPGAVIIVTGCLSQVAPETVAAIDGVSYICGNSRKADVIDAALSLVGKPKAEPIVDVSPVDVAPFERMSIEHFPRTRAYIKIEDGCESHCTYCIIPSARGKIRSKPREDVLNELCALARGGCREVVLTGIETASYGIDLGSYRLADLLCDADRLLGGEVRIRLGSLDPSLIKPAFVEKIAPLSSVAPHFHLSMQSGSDSVLAAMKRKYNTKMALAGMELLRSAMPDVQFTTDLIVGFPGETDDNFAETLEFVERAGFLSAHVFAYSKRKGTPAAERRDQVPENVKKERSAALIAACKRIGDGILEGQVGRSYPVLFETDSNGVSVGHTPSFIEVHVNSDAPLHSTVRNVRLTQACEGFCLGELED
ncbi:MAG: tRNA (N(6)-L-threonylcarbamoyladenosine(37)-C(2))-methylthiotransferase MtaB [Clostridia bacterium]|nr:tRNA (N(6)-L-threonylcarbamoyladenosine(37)-C(2))-methylthiotransferase MtaB [Clostridia bacterium]